jgi:3-carboxy-cis,cis-muconate cycloisomerase
VNAARCFHNEPIKVCEEKTLQLINSLATTPALAELFSDSSILKAMLHFEAALARVEASCNIIPQNAAEVIAAAANAEGFDIQAIIRDTQLSATPAVPLVKALTGRVRAKNAEAAGFVHWGATSQDVCDTALVLLLKQAQTILDSDLCRLQKSLRRFAEEHAGTVMLGRTLLQAAGPTTLGLKAAGWFAAVHRGHQRLSACFDDALILQFGGATGTLAALGNEGLAVGRTLADELGLKYPEAPWHAHRDRLAALLCACGVLAGSLAKMARDLVLMMQTEIGEAAEPAAQGRGGSSTMPQKQNPVGCVETLAAAVRVPALVSSFLSGMVQEHERAAGGWQAEWPIVAEIIQATGLAASAMAEVAEGLTINAARMSANIDATHGTIFSERAMILLARKIGRDKAKELVEQAARKSLEQKRRLSEVLRESPEAAQHLGADDLQNLENPQEYLGIADEFRKRLLQLDGKE